MIFFHFPSKETEERIEFSLLYRRKIFYQRELQISAAASSVILDFNLQNIPLQAWSSFPLQYFLSHCKTVQKFPLAIQLPSLNFRHNFVPPLKEKPLLNIFFKPKTAYSDIFLSHWEMRSSIIFFLTISTVCCLPAAVAFTDNA